METEKKHPKIFMALFGTFFKMFGWVKIENLFGWLLVKTMHDDKIPTDENLDSSIELLSFYMEKLWPLINFIIREKVMNFFRYKSKKLFLRIFLIGIIIGMGIGLYKIYNLYIEKPKVVYQKVKKEFTNGMIINRDTIVIPAERSILSKDNLDYFASEMDIKHWYDVRKQIIQETGFVSESCTMAYNLFGMKLPGQRETTAIGEFLGHAQYKHWVYSLYDYKLWQDITLESHPMKNNEKYTDWLKRIGYAKDESYTRAINNINWYNFKNENY